MTRGETGAATAAPGAPGADAQGPAAPVPVRGVHAGRAVPLPPGAAGRWLVVAGRAEAVVPDAIPVIDLLDAAGAVRHGPSECRLDRRGRPEAILFATADVAAARLSLVGQRPPAGSADRLAIRAIGRGAALVRLAVRARGGIGRLLGAVLRGHPRGLEARLRALGVALVPSGLRPRDARRWIAAFERVPPGEIAPSADDPPLAMLLFHDAPSGAALDASVASLGQQQRAVAWRLVGRGDAIAAALAPLSPPVSGVSAYVGLLQAGEVLPPHGAALAAASLRRAGYPPLAIADTAAIDPDGHRHAPAFRPSPDLPLMLSGVPARGLWLVRRDVLDASLGGLTHSAGPWAEPVRLDLWLRRREAGEAPGIRIARLLSDRRPDAESAPAEGLAAVAADYVDRAGLPFRVEATPACLRLRAASGAAARTITAIIPSTLVAAHAVRCIDAVARTTDHPSLRIVVALSGAADAAADANDAARGLEAAHPALSVRHYASDGFNFARTVNRAAADADTELLLLLNDDIVPLEPVWLRAMEAWFADERVVAVGARLLYPDRRIQHAGIVLGPATLCHHAFLGADEDGSDLPLLARLPREVLAVTGACLLVRRGAWEAIGGMDEAYGSGFNDVDLCLRLHERGGEIVLSDATLLHEESRTFGSHWSGERAALRGAAIRRMQHRFRAFVADDPFYNPNLDLVAERFWRPAWPPRQAGARSGNSPSRITR